MVETFVTVVETRTTFIPVVTVLTTVTIGLCDYLVKCQSPPQKVFGLLHLLHHRLLQWVRKCVCVCGGGGGNEREVKMRRGVSEKKQKNKGEKVMDKNLVMLILYTVR